MMLMHAERIRSLAMNLYERVCVCVWCGCAFPTPLDHIVRMHASGIERNEQHLYTILYKLLSNYLSWHLNWLPLTL